jgi:hypothetical protein
VQDVAFGVKAISSYAEGPLPISPPTTFREVLQKWQLMWMWDNLRWVGDDDWIAIAIAEGTCIAITNGLYMKDLYPNIQSAALVLKCTKGRGRLWCSSPEV